MLLYTVTCVVKSKAYLSSAFFSLADSELSVEVEPARKGFFRRLKDALWKEEDEDNKEQQTNKF